MASHMQEIFDLSALPPPSSYPEPEIMLHLRAESEAYAALEMLRDEALCRGELSYNAGPGKRRPRDWESLPEDDPLFRKEKKTKSAYVSRFRAKEYEQLLEGKVEEVEQLVVMKKSLLQREIIENNMLKEKIHRLQLELQKKDSYRSPMRIQCKTPDSPFSCVTGCSSPEQALKSIPEINVDDFALLPPTFPKMEAVLESWSSDESEDISDFLFQ